MATRAILKAGPTSGKMKLWKSGTTKAPLPFILLKRLLRKNGRIKGRGRSCPHTTLSRLRILKCSSRMWGLWAQDKMNLSKTTQLWWKFSIIKAKHYQTIRTNLIARIRGLGSTVLICSSSRSLKRKILKYCPELFPMDSNCICQWYRVLKNQMKNYLK